MKQDHDQFHKPDDKKRWWRSRDGVIMVIFLAFAGFFLITEHRAHVFQYLPWLIILACPFLHLFMHHGHGNHRDHNNSDNDGAS